MHSSREIAEATMRRIEAEHGANIWHSWYAPALAVIHTAPAGIDYADLTLTIEHARRLDPHNVAHCDRWLREIRLDDAVTQEIPRETLRQVAARYEVQS